MSSKKNKQTKEDFTSFLLEDGDSSNKTTVLPDSPSKEDRTNVLKESISNENFLSKIEGEEELHIPLVSEVEEEFPEEGFPKLSGEIEEDREKENTPSAILLEDVSMEDVLGKEEPKKKKTKKAQVETLLDPSMISVEAALKQSEHLKLAQTQIEKLKGQVESLSLENEQLSASAITLRERYDELSEKHDALVKSYEKGKISQKEERVQKNQLIDQLKKDNQSLDQKNKEFSNVLEERIKRSLVRERELRNRLELLQVEDGGVISNKDEVILDLKKQIDALSYDLEKISAQLRESRREGRQYKEKSHEIVLSLKRLIESLEDSEDVLSYKKTGS